MDKSLRKLRKHILEEGNIENIVFLPNRVEFNLYGQKFVLVERFEESFSWVFREAKIFDNDLLLPMFVDEHNIWVTLDYHRKPTKKDILHELLYVELEKLKEFAETGKIEGLDLIQPEQYELGIGFDKW